MWSNVLQSTAASVTLICRSNLDPFRGISHIWIISYHNFFWIIPCLREAENIIRHGDKSKVVQKITWI